MSQELDSLDGDLAFDDLRSVISRNIRPRFIKHISRESSPDRVQKSIESHLFKDSDKNYFQKSSLSKNGEMKQTSIASGLRKLGSLKLEEYSTQAYDLRSLKIHSKANLDAKRRISKPLLPQARFTKIQPNKYGNSPRRMSEVIEEENLSSLMACINDPKLGMLCEKNPFYPKNVNPRSSLTELGHLHEHTKSVRNSINFKNKFQRENSPSSKVAVKFVHQGSQFQLMHRIQQPKTFS